MPYISSVAAVARYVLCVLLALLPVFGLGMLVSDGSVGMALAAMVAWLLIPSITVVVLAVAAALNYFLFHHRNRR